jgi:hypothetical protein
LAWVLCAILFVSPSAAQTLSFDSGVDFSLSLNPHGVWQYGYSETVSLAPDRFRLDRHTSVQNHIGFWHPSGDDDGYYPYVAFNTSDQLQAYHPHSWAVRAGEVAMEGSNTGQYSPVRFLAPQTGTYRVSARFAGLHTGCNLSTKDAHVLHDAKSLFDALIEGYGGDEKIGIGDMPLAEPQTNPREVLTK